MAYTHVKATSVVTPEYTFTENGTTYTGDTSTAVSTTVDSYSGGAANAVAIAFTSAGFQSMTLQATVPCVVTFTGATVIDGVSISTVTLTADTIRHVAAITGNVTAVSVGANTTPAGAAGTININVLFNS
jgi:hypothetical protein